MSDEMGRWAALMAETMLLSADAAWVMGMRGAVLAGGGERAMREMAKMAEEKLVANVQFAAHLATGRIAATPEACTRSVLEHYGPVVRANRRRLATSGRGSRG